MNGIKKHEKYFVRCAIAYKRREGQQGLKKLGEQASCLFGECTGKMPMLPVIELEYPIINTE